MLGERCRIFTIRRVATSWSSRREISKAGMRAARRSCCGPQHGSADDRRGMIMDSVRLHQECHQSLLMRLSRVTNIHCPSSRSAKRGACATYRARPCSSRRSESVDLQLGRRRASFTASSSSRSGTLSARQPKPLLLSGSAYDPQLSRTNAPLV